MFSTSLGGRASHSLILISALLVAAGCSASGGQAIQPNPPIAPPAHRGGVPQVDGTFPLTGLTNVGGVLYGATTQGGATGNGTIFQIQTTGAEQVIYNFTGGADGGDPLGGNLVNLGPNNLLWGTTALGGTAGQGTVFNVTTSGTEAVAHSFGGGTADGAEPSGALIEVNGVIYGTTRFGGPTGSGTVFQIAPGSVYSVLSFLPGWSTGVSPWGGVTQGANNTMIGTAYAGGAHAKGVVFKVTTSGTYSVIKNLTRHTGENPASALVKLGNAYYGTAGGNIGTVFKVTASGSFTVLHAFTGADGFLPSAGLTYLGGVFYGTTVSGGAHNAGTVYSITPSGTFASLYSFQGGTDGSAPWSNLTDVGGTLYGTTLNGGTNSSGTVYSITTGGAENVIHSF